MTKILTAAVMNTLRMQTWRGQMALSLKYKGQTRENGDYALAYLQYKYSMFIGDKYNVMPPSSSEH